MIAFGLRSNLLLLGALNGALLAGLVLRARTNRGPNRLLAALIAMVVLRLVPFIIGYAGFYDAYPWLSFAPFDNQLAVAPLLWLYVVHLTTGGLPRRWWLHLLPAAADFLFSAIVFVACTVPQKNLIDATVNVWRTPLITVGALGGLAIYGRLAIGRYRAYQRWLDDQVSNREEYRLDWLRHLLVAFACTGLVWLGFAAVDALVTPLDYADLFPLYIWLSGLTYFLGLAGWRAAEQRYPLPGASATAATGVTHATDTQDTTVSSSAPPADAAPARATPDWAALGAEYAATIRANAWWRDPQLTLSELARRLVTNTSYVSRALNLGLGQSFNEFVNRLRVEAVAAELQAGSERDLVQIGFDAGFNSKASFQRAFRQYMDCTPSEYRARFRD